MGLKVLDERHKKLAELILKGTPRAQIAREIDVSRGTVYKWMEDELWQAYFNKLAEDVAAARKQRLMPVVTAATDALVTALHNATNDMNSGDVAIRAAAPPLDALTRAVKVVVELERVDQGQPSDIKESRASKERTPMSEGAKQLLDKLDDMVESETETPTATAAEGTEGESA